MKAACALACDVFESCVLSRKFRVGSVNVSMGCGIITGDCPDFCPTDMVMDVRSLLDDSDISDEVRLYVSTGNMCDGPAC